LPRQSALLLSHRRPNSRVDIDVGIGWGCTVGGAAGVAVRVGVGNGLGVGVRVGSILINGKYELYTLFSGTTTNNDIATASTNAASILIFVFHQIDADRYHQYDCHHDYDKLSQHQ
jgi:hypothetical protein